MRHLETRLIGLFANPAISTTYAVLRVLLLVPRQLRIASHPMFLLNTASQALPAARSTRSRSRVIGVAPDACTRRQRRRTQLWLAGWRSTGCSIPPLRPIWVLVWQACPNQSPGVRLLSQCRYSWFSEIHCMSPPYLFSFFKVVTGCPRAMRQTESLCSRRGGTERKCTEKDGVRDGLSGPARN